MKTKTLLNKFIGALLCLLATVTFAQTPKVIFDEKAVMDEMKKAGMPETEYEGYINFKRAEFEGKKNGTWEQPVSFKTFNADSPVVIGCVNADFADSTLNSWAGRTGCHPNSTASACNWGCCSEEGFVTNRHEIITTPGNDAIVGAALPRIPTGRNVVFKLGNNQTGAQAEEISKSFVVTSESTGFTYWYALVMQDGGNNHDNTEQPAFEIIMFDDVTGDTIPCSYYFVASGQGIPGFVNINASLIYKPWSTVTLDLNNYIGRQVTIRFRTFDCSLGGHYGYAYLSGDCFKSEIPDPYFCDGWNPDTLITLTAPSGYSSYEWRRNGNTIATTQNLDVEDPQLGDQYVVILTPFHTGDDSCGISLAYQIKLNPHPVLPDYLLKQNVFTPNKDNMNETFESHDFSWISKFQITIYDRWGKEVFTSNDPYVEWDGTTKSGNNASDGVYYWHAMYVSSCYPNSETPYLSKGFIHLLR